MSIGDSHAADPAVASSSYTAAERATAKQLIAENYDLLQRIARAKRRRAPVSTMATVDILHESYLKLDGQTKWRSSEHFIRAATLAMRCVIIDHARKKQTQKRGAAPTHVSIDDHESMLPEFAETPEQVVAIADLLEKLAQVNARWMLVVDARYFGGMTEAEAALTLQMSARTVRRDWHDARQWLARKLGVVK